MVEVKLSVQRQIQTDDEYQTNSERNMFMTPIQESLDELKEVQESCPDGNKFSGLDRGALKIPKTYGCLQIIPLCYQTECYLPRVAFCTSNVIKAETV